MFYFNKICLTLSIGATVSLIAEEANSEILTLFISRASDSIEQLDHIGRTSSLLPFNNSRKPKNNKNTYLLEHIS